MTQGFQLCVLDYDFMILNNAFLVHKPGIKTRAENKKNARFVHLYRGGLQCYAVIFDPLDSGA